VPTCRRVSPLENLPLEVMAVAFWFVNEIGKKNSTEDQPATYRTRVLPSRCRKLGKMMEAPATDIESCSEKVDRLFDQNMLQLLESERFFYNQVNLSDREVLWGIVRQE
jgi:hypothetical protein